MKTTSLFRLGGIAILLSAILVGIFDISYFLSGEQSPSNYVLWIGIIIDTLRVLGLGALFARQAYRGGMLGLIGYVLLVCGSLAGIGFWAVQFGVLAGIISDAELAQVSLYALGSTILIWSVNLGEVVFGISMLRAQVFPKYTGTLLILVGVLHYLTGSLAFTLPIYAILSVVVYAWLGWILTSTKVTGMEAI